MGATLAVRVAEQLGAPAPVETPEALARAVRTLVIAMLAARRPALAIGPDTMLREVFDRANDELSFIFDVADALGWQPVAGWITSTVPRRRVTVAEVVDAFARGAPEAA